MDVASTTIERKEMKKTLWLTFDILTTIKERERKKQLFHCSQKKMNFLNSLISPTEQLL